MAKDQVATTGRKTDLIVIGGSAGSLSFVLNMMPHLKASTFLAAILVLHRKQTEDSALIDVLRHRTVFRVKEADDKDEIVPGTIYVAPADYHVLIEKEKTITLDDSEKINYSRPSIDVTFESAADVYGDRLACVLLSGANADGTEGLIKAKKAGALVIIQDPQSAEVPVMPSEALARVKPDAIISEKDLGKTLRSLLGLR